VSAQGMGRPVRPRRPDESMTLITEMMQRPLDPGYASAARTREAAGLPPATGARSVLLVLVAVLIGLLFATSALALRAPATSASKAKAQLIDQIESRRAHGDAQSRRITALRSEINAAQAAALRSQSEGGLANDLRDLEAATGAGAVTGPGMRLTLDDAPAKDAAKNSDANPRNNGDADQGKVIARDLQIVVNGLWASGAEAVAVNGQRLTSKAAIRFAGQAILVNYRPLTRPYVITAIGDPKQLPVEFAASDGGSYLQSLKTNFGVRAGIQDVDRLTVPGESSLTTRVATPVPTTTGTSSATGGPTTSDTTESSP
jgi:uncharacterized protein YlxW (UPF0749 family)